MSARSWVEIDEARLGENCRVVSEAATADTDVLAVVKANAYGHGLGRCAVALVRVGAKWLGVADAAEGVRARHALDAGLIERDAVEILVMCGVTRDEVSAIADYALTPVVWTKEQVEWLAQVMHQRADAVRVHIEIETGMCRQGVRPGADLLDLLRSIESAGLEVDGVCTHFSSAEVAGSQRTEEQKRQFGKALEQVSKSGQTPQWIHAGSSSTVDVGEDAAWLEVLARSIGARAMVRCGLALYGYCMPAVREREANAAEGPAESHIRAKLKPVMTWKTRVLDVREVTAGEAIGYRATLTAKRPMRVALLPVGYADGLRRELSGTDERVGGWVMVRGTDDAVRRAPVVGRVSMNLTTVDVTEIDGIRVDDEVVLLGDGVTADDHARLAGTISYDILCGVRT